LKFVLCLIEENYRLFAVKVKRKDALNNI
jgi:hypothetical protein